MLGVSRSSQGSSQSGSVQKSEDAKDPNGADYRKNGNGRLMFYRRSRVPL